MRDCIVDTASFEQRRAKIVMRLGISGINRYCRFILIDRIANFTFLSEQAAKVVVRFRIGCPKRDRLAIVSYGVISFAMIPENDTQIVMRHPATGILRERPRV